MASTTSVTPDEAALIITRGGHSWTGTIGANGGTITYGFRETAPAYNTEQHDEKSTFTKFSAGQIQATTLALELWSDLTNINFARVGTGTSGSGAYTNDATMLFANYKHANDGAGAFSDFGSKGSKWFADRAGDVWVNVYVDAHVTLTSELLHLTQPNLKPTQGTIGFQSLLHEIGHTLGLEHPGDYNAAPNTNITYLDNAGFTEDSYQYTVMSYFNATVTGATEYYHGKYIYPGTPLLFDIAAIQRLYGVDTSTRTGDTVYGFHSNADRAVYRFNSANDDRILAIWDAGGNDTLDASGYYGNQTIDLRPGHFSSLGGLPGEAPMTNNVAVAAKPAGASTSLDYFIENGIGGDGADTIFGNERDNRLVGNVGADRLYGLLGNDILEGGKDNDRLEGGGGTDTAIFAGSVSDYRITTSYNGEITVEELFGSHDEGTDTLIGIRFARFGGTLVDLTVQVVHTPLPGGIFVPNPGEVIVSISGGPGDDTIGGGEGTVSYYGNGGNDDIYSSGGMHNYATSIFGGAGDDDLNGSGGNDNIFGGTENDRLNGKAGNDLMNGEEGLDWLAGDEGNDTLDGGANNDIVEGGAGFDTVRGGDGNDRLYGGHDASRFYTLADINIEDVLDGGAGDDRLFSPDLEGPDRLIGGTGFDFALIDRRSETVPLSFNLALIDLTQNLGDGTTILGIEQVEFRGSVLADLVTGGAFMDELHGWAGDDRLNGGAGDDELYGNSGNDRLDGGRHADMMAGGAGDDAYFVEDAGDFIVDDIGGGSDLLFIGNAAQYLLSDLAEIEEIRALPGVATLSVTGSRYDNKIEGTSGNDVINGAQGNDVINAGDGNDVLDGGARQDFTGADTLRGGKGNDTYYVDCEEDQIVDGAGQGFDTVHFTMSVVDATAGYTLGAADEIEVLDVNLADLLTSLTRVKLVGNDFNNKITGNDQPNEINGKGGTDIIDGLLGSDRLTGGAGHDTFIFGSAIKNVPAFSSETPNIDTIADFQHGVDKLLLFRVVFDNVRTNSAHVPLATDFTMNVSKPGNAHLLYQQSTGWLSYDSDGSGKAAPIHFATLLNGGAHPVLSAGDILVA